MLLPLDGAGSKGKDQQNRTERLGAERVGGVSIVKKLHIRATLKLHRIVVGSRGTGDKGQGTEGRGHAGRGGEHVEATNDVGNNGDNK